MKNITARFAKYLDNVPSDEPVILVSLHYIKDQQNMVLAIIKVANLKLLFNNKKPGVLSPIYYIMATRPLKLHHDFCRPVIEFCLKIIVT